MNRAKVLKTAGIEVILGLKNGETLTLPRSQFGFDPIVGAEVELYRNGEEYIVAPATSTTMGIQTQGFKVREGGDRSGTIKVNKIIYILLAFFLGSFGIHKFYEGKNIKGVIYLLLCWTFIPGLLGIIEAILMALKPADSNGLVQVKGRPIF